MKRGNKLWILALCFFLGILSGAFMLHNSRVNEQLQKLREESLNRDVGLGLMLLKEYDSLREEITVKENKATDSYSKIPYLVHLRVSGHQKPILPMLPPAPWNAMASGVLIRPDRETFVLTAAHTFEKPDVNLIDWIAVRLNIPGDTPHYAELYAWDPETDLALLRFTDGFSYDGPVAEIADSSDILVFTPVVALGSPMGLPFSGACGHVVSTNVLGFHNASPKWAIDRPEALVHSAPLAPGNSGGPLLNARTGQLIGINASIVYNGLYAAVPSEDILWILPQLVKGGQVKHGFIPGIEIQNTIDLPVRECPGGIRPAREGVLITKTRKGMLGGDVFEPHDIVVEVGGIPTPNAVSFWREVMYTPPKTTVSIKVIRGGNLVDLPVKLEEHIMN